MTLKGNHNHYNVKFLKGYGFSISVKDSKIVLKNCYDPFSMYHHGRRDRELNLDLSRTINCFADVYETPFSAPSNNKISIESLNHTHKQFVEYGQRFRSFPVLKYMTQDLEVKKFMKSLPESDISLNMLPNVEPLKATTVTNGGITSVAYPELELKKIEMNPNLDRIHLLYIESYIENGRAKLSIYYSKALLKDETVKKFGNDVIAEMKNILSLFR